MTAMHKLKLQHFTIGLFMGLVLTTMGCTSNPYSGVTIDSTNKALAVATAELRASNLLLQEVIQSRLINRAQAQQIKDQLQEGLNVVSASAAAVALSGDPADGQDGLDRATRAIDFALAILAPLVAQLPPQSRFELQRDIHELYSDHGLKWSPGKLEPIQDLQAGHVWDDPPLPMPPVPPNPDDDDIYINLTLEAA